MVEMKSLREVCCFGGPSNIHTIFRPGQVVRGEESRGLTRDAGGLLPFAPLQRTLLEQIRGVRGRRCVHCGNVPMEPCVRGASGGCCARPESIRKRRGIENPNQARAEFSASTRVRSPQLGQATWGS